jgi:hypothetical protein
MKLTLFIKYFELETIHINAHYNIHDCICKHYNVDKLNLYHQGKLFTNQKIENFSTLHASLPIIGGIPVLEAVLDGAATASLVEKTINDNEVLIANQEKTIWGKIMKVKQVIFENKKFLFMIEKFAKFFAFLQRMLPILYLVLIILAFFGKPLEYIMLFVALIAVAIIYVIYAILTIPPFVFIPMLLWFIIFNILPLIVYCLIFGALLVFILVICLIISILNVASGGALKNLILCQNSPTAWYKTPNFHFKNAYERGLFCNSPCKTRYQPDATGTSCVKLPKGYPAFCPQAEIVRLYTGMRKDHTYMYNDYPVNGNIKYLTKSPSMREELLKNYFLKKNDFMNVCNDKMSSYNNISLSICSSLDMIDSDTGNSFTKGMSSSEINKIRQVCKQAYCNSKNTFPFCSQLGNTQEDNSDIIKKVIKLAIFIIVFITLLIISLKYLISLQKN